VTPEAFGGEAQRVNPGLHTGPTFFPGRTLLALTHDRKDSHPRAQGTQGNQQTAVFVTHHREERRLATRRRPCRQENFKSGRQKLSSRQRRAAFLCDPSQSYRREGTSLSSSWRFEILAAGKPGKVASPLFMRPEDVLLAEEIREFDQELVRGRIAKSPATVLSFLLIGVLLNAR
jgi:hypothetical protein